MPAAPSLEAKREILRYLGGRPAGKLLKFDTFFNADVELFGKAGEHEPMYNTLLSTRIAASWTSLVPSNYLTQATAKKIRIWNLLVFKQRYDRIVEESASKSQPFDLPPSDTLIRFSK